MYPATHVQLYVLMPFVQLAPFVHSELAQLLITVQSSVTIIHAHVHKHLLFHQTYTCMHVQHIK